MITRTFKLCLNAGTGSAPYINVSQYDEGETWLFELYSETGERYIPSTGAIVGVKSDGHGIINTGTVDNEGRVVITETQQMTAATGRAIFELSIDGLTHGTANFIVAVERKPTDEAVMSDSDLSLIQQATDAAETIEELIEGHDPDEVIADAVDAWLDNHPEATTTVQDGAITAPKINNSLWDKILVNEEVSGNPASFDDGADDVPVSSLKVNLEPIQTGTGDPSPSNVRPIIAANGKNLFKLNENDVSSSADDVTIAYNAQRDEFTISGTNTNTSAHLVMNRTPFAIPSFVAGETYCVSLTKPTGGLYYLNTTYKTASNATKAFTLTAIEANKSWQFTVPNDYSTFYRFQIGVYGTATTIPTTVFGVQIEKGSAPSTYQPYQGIMVEQTNGNLINPSDFITVAGTTKAISGDSITISGDGSAQYQGIQIGRNTQLKFPAGTYYVKANISSITHTNYRMLMGFRNGSNTFVAYETLSLGQMAFTVSTSVDTFFCITVNGTENSANTVVLENLIVSKIDMPYEPYVSTITYPYSLGQSVYGGSVDLATGVLTVTHAYIDLGDLNWGMNTANNFFYGTGTSNPLLEQLITQRATTGIRGAICEAYFDDVDFSALADLQDGAFVFNSAKISSTKNSLMIKDTRYTDATNFKTAVNGVHFVAELASPTTINLTPTQVKTLLGYNNISSSGTVDVIYHADTKLYVDKMTAVDNNIIAPTEEGFTATRNYTVNDLVIVNDTLYKVTANIATGSAITPNSNVQQTTLSALIKALS